MWRAARRGVALGLALLTMMDYLVMAVGQMFSHRIVMSVVAFIGLDILATLYLNLTDELELVEMISNLGQHAGLWMANAMILFPTAVLFLATSWLLKHRLNLEASGRTALAVAVRPGPGPPGGKGPTAAMIPRARADKVRARFCCFQGNISRRNCWLRLFPRGLACSGRPFPLS